MSPFLSYFFKEIYARIGRHHLTAFSAQMAYFFVLAIFPFMIFLFAILSRLQVAYDFMSSSNLEFIPREALIVVQEYIKNNLAADSGSVLSVSILAALWSASKAVGALQRALNAAFEVGSRKSPFTAIALSLVFTMGLSFAVVIMLILPSLSSQVIEAIRLYIPIPEAFVTLFKIVRWSLVIAVPFLVLTQMYQHLPNLKLRFVEILSGTIFSYFGWIGISFLFSFFIQNFSNISLVYGSLAAFVVLMIWFYFTGMILMLGGEVISITKSYKAEKV